MLHHYIPINISCQTAGLLLSISFLSAAAAIFFTGAS